MINFRKLKKHLPKPRALGFPSNKAMSPELWNQYYEVLHQKYPLKSFLILSIPKALNTMEDKLDDLKYKITSHIYPNKRFHLLDLRQPKSNDANGDDYYRYGWIDSDKQILFACFNILNRFVEKELKYFSDPTDEHMELAKDDRDLYNSLLEVQEARKEIMALHKYWNVDRKQATKELNDALIFQNRKEKVVNYMELQNKFDKIEQEMLIRLIKIRNRLWT